MKSIGSLFLSLLLSFIIVSCNNDYSKKDVVSISEPTSFQEVAFEDVATDIKIVPLISDEPIDRCGELKCYGSETFIRSSDRRTLFYFQDGHMVSKLKRVGRGPGEYLSITSFVYSPSRKVLYVFSSDNNSIYQYSVPDMRYMKALSVERMVCFAEHDDSTLIARIADKNDGNGIYFLNANSGKKVAKLKNITGFSASFNDRMDYYQPNHRILSEMGGINIVSEVPAKIDVKDKIRFVYDFGNYGIPSQYEDANLYDFSSMMGLTNYVQENKDKVYVGGFNYMLYNKEVSFWFRRITTENKADMIYFWTDGKDTKLYGGFRASAMRFPIIPDCLTDNGYVTIIEGSPDFLFDSQQEFSPITEDIRNVMKTQELNNPVIIYYRIQ